MGRPDAEKHICQRYLKKICSVVLNEKELTEKIFPIFQNLKVLSSIISIKILMKNLFSLLNFTKQLDIAVLILTKNSVKKFWH